MNASQPVTAPGQTQKNFYDISDLVHANTQTEPVTALECQTRSECTAAQDEADLQPSSIERGTQTQSYAEDVQRLSSISGPGVAFRGSAIDVVVECEKTFLSADLYPVELATGLRGIVTRYDKDGDAHMFFPELAENGVLNKIVVLADDFANFRQLTT